MEIALISRKRYTHTMLWAVLLSSVVVALAATLGRAMANVKAALTDKPDIAVYLLLKDDVVTSSTLLRSYDSERDYLVETKDGPKLVKLKKGEKEWFVVSKERMHE
jgi:acetylglutamate synthase